MSCILYEASWDKHCSTIPVHGPHLQPTNNRDQTVNHEAAHIFFPPPARLNASRDYDRVWRSSAEQSWGSGCRNKRENTFHRLGFDYKPVATWWGTRRRREITCRHSEQTTSFVPPLNKLFRAHEEVEALSGEHHISVPSVRSSFLRTCYRSWKVMKCA